MTTGEPAKDILGFEAKDIDGLTNKNYTQLQELHSKYAEKGLRILAFPCNQFGGQEPGNEAAIKEFVKGFGVEFDMFSKIEVNGDNTHPLYVFLKKSKRGLLGNRIKWNFSKFLCDRSGVPYKRYAPTTAPLSIEKDIVALLEAAPL